MSVRTENITAKFHQKMPSGCLKICKIRQGITCFCCTLYCCTTAVVVQLFILCYDAALENTIYYDNFILLNNGNNTCYIYKAVSCLFLWSNLISKRHSTNITISTIHISRENTPLAQSTPARVQKVHYKKHITHSIN